MKFHRNKTPFDCAVISIINTYVLLGHKVKFNSAYKYLTKKLKVNKGVLPKDFDKVVMDKMPALNVIRKHKKPTIAILRKELKLGNIIILGTDYKGWSHIGVVLKFTKEYAIVINWGKEHDVVRKVHLDTLKEWMSDWSVAYVVKKEKS